MDTPRRIQADTPTDGQFAPGVHAETSVTLDQAPVESQPMSRIERYAADLTLASQDREKWCISGKCTLTYEGDQDRLHLRSAHCPPFNPAQLHDARRNGWLPAKERTVTPEPVSQPARAKPLPPLSSRIGQYADDLTRASQDREHLCISGDCRSTNWGGRDRLHTRDSRCPPFNERQLSEAVQRGWLPSAPPRAAVGRGETFDINFAVEPTNQASVLADLKNRFGTEKVALLGDTSARDDPAPDLGPQPDADPSTPKPDPALIAAKVPYERRFEAAGPQRETPSVPYRWNESFYVERRAAARHIATFRRGQSVVVTDIGGRKLVGKITGPSWNSSTDNPGVAVILGIGRYSAAVGAQDLATGDSGLRAADPDEQQRANEQFAAAQAENDAYRAAGRRRSAQE